MWSATPAGRRMSGQCGFNLENGTRWLRKCWTNGTARRTLSLNVRTDYGNLYILRRNTSAYEWTLECFRQLRD